MNAGQKRKTLGNLKDFKQIHPFQKGNYKWRMFLKPKVRVPFVKRQRIRGNSQKGTN